MKKTLIIVGSARKGNSLYVGEYTRQFLLKKGEDVELIQLSDYTINYCDGCLECDSTGVCHKKDDVALLLGKVKEAANVIFITPTRWSLLAGDMKVFMDRWNPLAGRNIFDNKRSFLVAIGQTKLKDSSSIQSALTSLKFFSDDEDCLNSTDVKEKNSDLISYSKKLEKFIL